jgi:hypothetical protein
MVSTFQYMLAARRLARRNDPNDLIALAVAMTHRQDAQFGAQAEQNGSPRFPG